MKRAYYLLILLIISGFTPSSRNGDLEVPEWLNGMWTGVGYQIDGRTWSVELSKEAGVNKLKVAYPSLSCSGDWKPTKITEQRLEFTEMISVGKDKCDVMCKLVVFKIDNRQISVNYFIPSLQEEAIAYSVLVKQ